MARPTILYAQATAQRYQPPRTADGRPDLQGVWQALNTAVWDIQDHSAELGVPAGQGIVEGNELPYRPEALKQREANRKNRATGDPEAKCWMVGVPRIMYMPFPLEIVQTPTQVTILSEYAHTVRRIYMNGQHLEGEAGDIEWFMGDSRGRWDGDTLVVDVVHFTGETWFDRSGNFHSNALHVVERFTRTGPDHLLYEATIEDPKVFTRPWKISMPLYRRVEPNARLLEYECPAMRELKKDASREGRRMRRPLGGIMRTQRLFIVVLTLALAAAWAVQAQIADPIPVPVSKRGLAVEIRDVVRLPRTLGLRPPDQDVNPAGWARVSYVRDIADGRRFANDSRGFLYLLDSNNQPTVYANVGEAFPFAIYSRLESGFIGFDFHPEFAKNGLFYTVHGERAMGNPATPHFIPPGYTQADVMHHNVITEWRAKNPAAATFEGTRRELLRVGQVVQNLTHPFGHLEFNPTSKPGAPDYGLLYTSGSDLGFSNGGGPNANNPGQTQRLDSLITAILRIDPRSPAESRGMKGLGDYTLPAVNKFAADGDPKTLGEIFAYGFRNAHRLSWDLTDGTMFASDIGMNHIEEINIVREGGNYGWMKREGIFENGMTRSGGALNQLFALPADVLSGRTKDEFTYPVAMYDHSDGQAVTGGFAYYGRIPALRGKFVFGDITRGRLFAADTAALKKADDGIPETVAPVEEIQLYVRDAAGNRIYTSLRELAERTMGATLTRADLHISRDRDGELFITSRQDGMIRMLVPDSGTNTSSR